MSVCPIMTRENKSADVATLRVFFVFQDAIHHPRLTDALAVAAKRSQFKGNVEQSCWLSTQENECIAAIGAGPSQKPGQCRRAGFYAIQKARDLQIEELIVELDESLSPQHVQELVQGLILSTYDFDRYKKKKSPDETPGELQRMIIHAPDTLKAAVTKGQMLSQAVVFARDLANEGPNICTPRWLAQQAYDRAMSIGLQAKVLDEDILRAKGFNLHLAVAKGSDEPARLFHAIYEPSGPVHKTIALVGKGVTFDAGGYSMKPPASLVDMHIDMGGGAAVIGAMDAIAQLKPQHVAVHFIVPMAENLVSGTAYKVNDILTGLSGKSVEILNTDAEGRLLLADALTYAQEQSVDTIIDCATLTGAAVVALGPYTAGLFSNDDALRQAVLDAATAADESMWPLPLFDRLDAQLNSRRADIKNVGSRWGGAITAALFLQHFVDKTPWAHIDLAGPAMVENGWEYIPTGGTGYGVLLLTEYVENLARTAAQ